MAEAKRKQALLVEQAGLTVDRPLANQIGALLAGHPLGTAIGTLVHMTINALAEAGTADFKDNATAVGAIFQTATLGKPKPALVVTRQ